MFYGVLIQCMINFCLICLSQYWSCSYTWNQKSNLQLNPPVFTAVMFSFVFNRYQSWLLLHHGVSLYRRKEIYCKFFPGSYQQRCGKTIKNITYRLKQTVKLKKNIRTFTTVFFIFVTNKNFYLWDVNQFIQRWNCPVERIPRMEQCFVICHDAYCWLDGMKGK